MSKFKEKLKGEVQRLENSVVDVLDDNVFDAADFDRHCFCTRDDVVGLIKDLFRDWMKQHLEEGEPDPAIDVPMDREDIVQFGCGAEPPQL